MALLSSSSPRASLSAFSFSSSFWSSSSLSSKVLSSTLAITAGTSIYRFLMKPIDRHAKSFNGGCIHAPIMTNKRAGIIVNVSFEIADGGGFQSESDDEEDVAFDKLPVDPKLQQKLEHKMRTKFSKKIRLRGKKLLRTRRMRKRGRWPPSKVKK